MVGTSTWREQFIDAIKVNADDDDDDDDDNEGDAKNKDAIEGGENQGEAKEKEEKHPSCGDYLIHFVSLFWKILFAFVPPTGIYLPSILLYI